ncbi:MAG: hypothetical protein U0S48_06065 [Solirubrobacteraceae bacterium]
MEHAWIDPPGPAASPAVPCCVLRRAAAARPAPAVSRGTVEEILAAYGDQLRTAGWQLGIAGDAYVHIEAPVAAATRRRRPSASDPADGPAPSTAWSAAATDLVRECERFSSSSATSCGARAA